MAKRLEISSLPSKQGGPRRDYPAEWLDGSVWELNIKEDAPQAKHSESLVNSIRGFARPLGYKIRSRKISNEVVWIQAFEIEGEEDQ